ncbi:hypothetical protein JJC04_07405 [Flavobacterium covae]|nr:hypothetical protein [Flavobacterium covae]QYS92315.1 hypothetical protein JJC04_07405 [Flavobacterium covae]
MLKAVNWPDMLTRMCKEVAGFSNAISHNLGFNAINNKKGSFLQEFTIIFQTAI